MTGLLIKMLMSTALLGGGGSHSATVTFAPAYAPAARTAAIRNAGGRVLSRHRRTVVAELTPSAAADLRSAMGVLRVR